MKSLIAASCFMAALFGATKTDETHYAIGLSPDGTRIELEDRSIWEIPRDDAAIVAEWNVDARYEDERPVPLFIYPNTCSWHFTNKSYIMRNMDTGDEIYTDLKQSPDENNKHTCLIHKISLKEPSIKVVLNDGATREYRLDPKQLSDIRKWRRNDIVIIASNRGWFIGDFPLIMINVDCNNRTVCNKRY